MSPSELYTYRRALARAAAAEDHATDLGAELAAEVASRPQWEAETRKRIDAQAEARIATYEAELYRERVRASNDIAQRDHQLRVYSAQLRYIRGILNAVPADSWLPADECRQALSDLDAIAEETR